MLKHILPLIPDHTIYTEAFCGGAAVLYAKPPVAAEIINDLNGELINLYCVAKAYAPLLIAEIGRTLHARYHYNRAFAIYSHPDSCTPIERAWTVWALSKLSYASRHGWITHRIERVITASRTIAARRRQQEWIVCNYIAPQPELQLF